MFVYYQTNQKSKWKFVLESEAALSKLKEEQVPMQSVLSIKEPLDADDDKHGRSYKGPFYADIDVDGDPEAAINSAIKFADKLEKEGIDSYSVYLSGKKGFHFIVPMKTFASERPAKSLPLIYKELALDMFVEGIDMSVYSEGKPHLLRTANVKRKDNGKYKVQITPEELYKLTPEKYSQLTEQPRPEFKPPEPKLSLSFQAKFELARTRMQKKQRSMANVEFVPNEELEKTVSEDGSLPRCIQLLIEQGDTKSGANFNQATIQFATFMVKAGVKDWLTHAKTMAKNVKSSSYSSEHARLMELKKMVSYVAGSPQYKFSKAMLFSVMEPCRDCAICNGTVEDGTVVPEDYEEYSEISETPTGYYIGQGKSQRQLTTFTLDVISRFCVPSDDEDESETRVGSHAIVKINGHKRDRITLLETVWNSGRDFKSAIQGKSNYAFYGTDVDLQKLQNKLFANEEDMGEIIYVHTMGIHRHKVGKNQTILAYVEPGFSMNSLREKNTHELWGVMPSPPNIQEATYPTPNDDLKELIDNMLNCNDPLVTCTLIGWMALCHIKVQLTMRDNQFPLLNLWGNAGCVDCDTEFLTPTGWKRIADYVEGDEVCQWQPDGTTEFVRPLDYIKAPCEELLRFTTDKVDMVVSRDHRVPYLSNSEVRTSPAKKILNTFGIQLPLAEGTEHTDASKVTVFAPRDGHQYCFTTPSTFWLARRSGTIFPTGNSGKSALSSLFAYLHGIDYMLEHSPMSLQGTTPWAVAQYCATSESTVRLIEEFNRSEIRASAYDQFTGMFKAAWNKQTFAKGGVDKVNAGGTTRQGVKVIETKISAPLCVMSEQAPDRPALRQRMVQLNVNKAGREREGAEDAFHYLTDHKDKLAGLARAMVFESLQTHPEEVMKTMEHYKQFVPKEIDARPQFSYQAVLTGVYFFGKTLRSIELDEDYVKEKVAFMESVIIDNLKASLSDIRIEKSRTEVSLVLTTMALMANAHDQQEMQYSLEPGVNYYWEGESLYLDTTVCHMLYTRWARQSGDRVMIGALQQFEVLLSQEDFFKQWTRHPSIGEGVRKLAEMDVATMQSRGIDVSMFKKAGG